MAKIQLDAITDISDPKFQVFYDTIRRILRWLETELEITGLSCRIKDVPLYLPGERKLKGFFASLAWQSEVFINLGYREPEERIEISYPGVKGGPDIAFSALDDIRNEAFMRIIARIIAPLRRRYEAHAKIYKKATSLIRPLTLTTEALKTEL